MQSEKILSLLSPYTNRHNNNCCTHCIWAEYEDGFIHYGGCQVRCQLFAAMIVKQLQHLGIVFQLQYTQCVLVNVHRDFEKLCELLTTVTATVHTIGRKKVATCVDYKKCPRISLLFNNKNAHEICHV